MAFEIVMPRLGWTMEEGTFGEWLVEDGAEINPGDSLFTVEGDKATEEVAAFDGGILRIPPDAPRPGDVVPVGGLIAYVVQQGERPPFEGKAASVGSGSHTIESAGGSLAPSLAAAQGANRTQRMTRRRKPAISPRARRVAAELGVDWEQLDGSGRTGRIVERDVRAAAAAQAAAPKVRASPVAQRMAADAGIDLADLARQKGGGRIQREDVAAAVAERTGPAAQAATPGEAVPTSRIRRLIAERMLTSTQTTAPVTLTTEADATELALLRAQFKATFEPRGLAVPTYNDMLIKLTAVALQEHPLLNAVWHEHEIILHSAVHISLAVDTDEGLLTPVVRNVQAQSLRQIAAESAALIEKAQARHLSPDDLQGGTFTITNLGMYGIDAFTPIINLPQCAILGVGRIVAKPAVVDDQIVPRKMVALSLTFDHRVVDGGPAARFLQTVREYVEEPALWLIA